MKKEQEKTAPFKVGDYVTTDYGSCEKKVVRQITKIEPDLGCGSGFKAWADGGKLCEHCGCTPAAPTPRSGIDSAWFKKAVED